MSYFLDTITSILNDNVPMKDVIRLFWSKGLVKSIVTCPRYSAFMKLSKFESNINGNIVFDRVKRELQLIL
jgi:hypothetical protein